MPRRDGTGPMGMGSRTGRGMGSCNIISPQNQKDLLTKQKASLENRLNLINNKLNTLQNDE